MYGALNPKMTYLKVQERQHLIIFSHDKRNKQSQRRIYLFTRHYSALLPRLTKYYCGYFVDDELEECDYFWMGYKTKTHNTKIISNVRYKRLL